MRWKFDRDKYILSNEFGDNIELDGEDLMIVLAHSDYKHDLIEKWYENLPLSKRDTALDYRNVRYKHIKERVSFMNLRENMPQEFECDDLDDYE